MSDTENIILDSKKEEIKLTNENQKAMEALYEKKAILEIQANQKTMQDRLIQTTTENGIVNAFYKDQKGNLVEIKNQENIDLAISVKAKQLELQNDFNDTSKILRQKLVLQRSHLEELTTAYAKYHANLKDETAKLAQGLIAQYNSIADSLRSVINLQRSAGVGSSGTPTNATRAFG